MSGPSRVQGQHSGVLFPTNIDPLREYGAAFLTEAFRANGAIAPDNGVRRITGFEEFFGGGAGRKLLLSVEYEHVEPGLHTELFVKYPRDFGDPLRPLFSHLMAPETRFALLSRRADFPVAVPKCYFSDYDPDSSTGILITERIAFGQNGVEPFHDKCLDYEIDDPLEHYRALIRAAARLAGFHKAGRFGPEVDQQFPHDPTRIRDDDRIPYTPESLREKLRVLTEFAQQHPGLLPENVREPAFLDRFAAEALQFLHAELPIKRYLNAQADGIALCHWNANIDNAWFWRQADGELRAGLLDWGSVGQMHVAQSIFGVLCACETTFWAAHKTELVSLFASEYAEHGGPRIAPDILNLQLKLFVAMLGMAWMLDAPSIIRAQLPQLHSIRDRHDPAFKSDFLARAQLQLMNVFLNAWQREEFGAVLQQFLRIRT